MRYFFISDLHGCDPNIPQIALAVKGFKPEQDVLVMVGDICDRGPYTMELIRWFNSLPNKISIRGNHDFRVYEILHRNAHIQNYDKQNGVGATFGSLLGWSIERCNKRHLWIATQTLSTERVTNPVVKANIKTFEEFEASSVWAIEWPDLIATHGWLPCDTPTCPSTLVNPELADINQWWEAIWADVEFFMNTGLYPNKKLLIGHWHAWRLRAKAAHMTAEKWLQQQILGGGVDYGIYEDDKLIAIDPCVQASNQVNVYVYESNVEPIVYGTKCKMPISAWRILFDE